MSSKRRLVDESYDDDDGSDDSRDETQPDLERSIKELYQKDDLQEEGEQAISRKVGLICKLEEARQEEAALERIARRMAWSREVRRTIRCNAEFKEIMEEVPLEDVEVEEKPRMTRMSMEWREAFKSERAGILFPQVLSTLLKSTVAESPTHENLVYRLVCKASKESVDALLAGEQFSPATWTSVDSFYIPHYIYKTMGISQFGNLERVKAFRREFSHAANPFFTRNIDISTPVGSSGTSHEFLQGIEEILRRWGTELWSVVLSLGKGMPAELMYDLLVTWLKLMPNLRFFRLVIWDGNYEIIPEEFPRLWEHIGRNPLPDMAHLVHLAIQSSSPGSLIANALLFKFNSRLERIVLEFNTAFHRLQISDTVSNCGPPATLEGTFPVLGNLRAYYRDVRSVADVRNIMKNFSKWQLPLKRLELELHNVGIEGGKGFGRILLLDNKALACQGVFLDMPQLEELSLILYYRINLRSLDFLLPCKALKVLIIHNTRVESSWKPRRNQQPPEDNGLLRFPTDPADEDRIYQSLIWKLLPELKLIVLKTVPLKKDGKFERGMSLQYMTVGNQETYEYTRDEYLQQGRGN